MPILLRVFKILFKSSFINQIKVIYQNLQHMWRRMLEAFFLNQHCTDSFSQINSNQDTHKVRFLNIRLANKKSSSFLYTSRRQF